MNLRTALQRSLAGQALLLLGFAAPASASLQGTGPALPSAPSVPAPSVRLSGWFSGDTHEHIQLCDNSVISLDEIRARMVVEDLDVASVLIWHRAALPYTQFVCNLGPRVPTAGLDKIIEFGVETSGLSCAYWGHLIGLGIGPTQARIARGSMQEGDCADMAGLGFAGDGSGTINAPVAEHFFTAPGAVCGYAHTIWTRGLYHPDGQAWGAELLASGFTTDAAYLDPGQPLSMPDLERLLGLSIAQSSARVFFPMFGAVDAALGHVQFVETITMGPALPFPTSPPSHWTELYYKLLSAGLRIGLAGGSDRACFPTPVGQPPVRTHVLVDGPLSYRAWTQGLAEGRSSIVEGNDIFLRLTLDGHEVGSDVPLSASDPRTDALVLVRSSEPLQDSVELLVGGSVHESRAFTLSEPGVFSVAFSDLQLDGSTWIAARLGSQRAHTAAIFAIVDGRPVADPVFAEYWMVWCDLVSKATLEHPELDFFMGQSDDVLERVALARRVFKTLRDQSFDPSWGVTRQGRSTPACRGPITIGAMGPARAGQAFQLTCMNAPPEADGLLVLSQRPLSDAGGSLPIPASALQLIETYRVRSTRSGYAEVLVPGLPAGVPDVHAQFLWQNPPGCRGVDGARQSSSDRLRLLVR